MSNFKIKIDTKKFEKQLNKQIEEIAFEKQKEIIKKQLIKGDNEMNILPNKEEILLEIILNKYDGNENMIVNGSYDEIPSNMHLGIKNIFRTLELYNYIGHFEQWLDGWSVVLNQEGIEYFEKKGMRKELFEELADNEKELLKEIIEIEKNNGNISEFLVNKVNEDKNDITRGIIGSLKTNGLLNLIWADGTVYNAVLTQPGRTYFEREEKYFKRMKESANNTYNVGNIYADGSNVVIGDVINSSLNIDNSYTRIENRIEQECNQEDKLEIKELLEETKEIIDNMKKNGSIGQRKSFFKRLTDHACKYGWLYAEIVNLIGNAAIGIIGGK